MSKSGIDQEALISMFAQAGARQSEALRQGVHDATLRALQGRELTMKNIRSVLKGVTEAASAGVAQNPSAEAAEGLIAQAVTGMDQALMQAVEANRRVLQQLLDQGAALRDKPLKGALGDLEKMEDTFFATLRKAVESGGEAMAGPWDQVLSAMQAKGTASGARAHEAVQQLLDRTQAAMRDSRAIGLKATQAWMDSYAALASGVLIGMTEAMQQAGSAAAPASPARKRAPK